MCNQGNKSHISNILTVTNILTGANQYAGENLTYLKLADVCRIKILFSQNRMAGLL